MASSPAAKLSKDQFYSGFKGMLAAPNLFIKPPINSLPVAPEQEVPARAASDALYETCEDVSWLNFLIQPGNKWAERAVVVGIFVFGKGAAVRAELASREKPHGVKQPARSGGEGERSASPPHQDMTVLEPANDNIKKDSA